MAYHEDYADLIPKVDVSRQIDEIANKTQIVDEYWEERVEALNILPTLMLEMEPRLFCSKIGKLKDCFLLQLKDLRSSVVKEVCKVINKLCGYCKEHFEWMAEQILPSLLKLLGSSNKVMSGYANKCIENLIEHSCNCKFIYLIIEATYHKNSSLRNYCYCYISRIVCNEKNISSVERFKKKLLDLLKNGLIDPSSQVRSISVELYWNLYPIFTSQTVQILSTIPKQKQKLVLAAKPSDIQHVASSNLKTPAQPSTKKPQFSSIKTDEKSSKSSIHGNVNSVPAPLFSRVPRTSERRESISQQVRNSAKSRDVLKTPKTIGNSSTNQSLMKTPLTSATSSIYSKRDNHDTQSRRESFHYRINKSNRNRNTRADNTNTINVNSPSKSAANLFSQPQRVRRQTISSKFTPKKPTNKENTANHNNSIHLNVLSTPSSINTTTQNISENKYDIDDENNISESPSLPIPNGIGKLNKKKRKSSSVPLSPPLSPISDKTFAMFSPAPGNNQIQQQTPSPGALKTPSRSRARRSGYSLSPTRSKTPKTSLTPEDEDDYEENQEEEIQKKPSKKRISVAQIDVDENNDNNSINSKKMINYDAFEEICNSLENATSKKEQLNSIRELSDIWEEFFMEDLISNIEKDDEIKFLSPLENILMILQMSNGINGSEVIQEGLSCISRALYCFSDCFENWLENLPDSKFPFGGLIGVVQFLIANPSLSLNNNSAVCEELSLHVFAEQFFDSYLSLSSNCNLFKIILNMLKLILNGDKNVADDHVDISKILDKKCKFIEGILVILQKFCKDENSSTLFESNEFKLIINSIVYLQQNSKLQNINTILSVFIEDFYQCNPLLFCISISSISNDITDNWKEWTGISILNNDEISIIEQIITGEKNLKNIIGLILKTSCNPILSQQILKWSSNQSTEFANELSILANLKKTNPSIWKILSQSQNERLQNFIVPFLEFEDISIRNNRIQCYRLNELQLKSLCLYQNLLSEFKADDNIIFGAISRMFSIHSNTLHPDIRIQSESCLLMLCSKLDTSKLIELISQIFEDTFETDEYEDTLSDHFYILTCLIKGNPKNTSWILSICSSSILQRALKENSVQIQFAVFECLTSLITTEPEKTKKAVEKISGFHKALLEYKCTNVQEVM